jgi:DNA-directed RNA polymerase specialized sigma24 family protein
MGVQDIAKATSTLTRVGANRDPEALSQLYDCYAATVYQIGLLAGYGRVQSEHFVENVFYSVWKTAQRYDGGMGEREWIVAIALKTIGVAARPVVRSVVPRKSSVAPRPA